MPHAGGMKCNFLSNHPSQGKWIAEDWKPVRFEEDNETRGLTIFLTDWWHIAADATWQAQCRRATPMTDFYNFLINISSIGVDEPAMQHRTQVDRRACFDKWETNKRLLLRASYHTKSDRYHAEVARCE